MPGPMTDREFQARDDMHTLAQAAEINGDQGRVARAKEAAQREEQRFAEIGKKIPGRPAKPVNGGVKNSRMARTR